MAVAVVASTAIMWLSEEAWQLIGGVMKAEKSYQSL